MGELLHPSSTILSLEIVLPSFVELLHTERGDWEKCRDPRCEHALVLDGIHQESSVHNQLRSYDKRGIHRGQKQRDLRYFFRIAKALEQ